MFRRALSVDETTLGELTLLRFWSLTHGFPAEAEGSCLDNKSDSAALNCQGNNLWPYLGRAKQHNQPADVEGNTQKLQFKMVKSSTGVMWKAEATLPLPTSKSWVQLLHIKKENYFLLFWQKK